MSLEAGFLVRLLGAFRRERTAALGAARRRANRQASGWAREEVLMSLNLGPVFTYSQHLARLVSRTILTNWLSESTFVVVSVPIAFLFAVKKCRLARGRIIRNGFMNG